MAVSCLGSCITQDSVEDVCFTTIQYDDGTLAHVHVSWLNPRKVRTLTVVGSTKMAHWDDIDPVDTLRLFDKGLAEEPTYNSFGEFQCSPGSRGSCSSKALCTLGNSRFSDFFDFCFTFSAQISH